MAMERVSKDPKGMAKTAELLIKSAALAASFRGRDDIVFS
jgi:hypothetical protein